MITFDEHSLIMCTMNGGLRQLLCNHRWVLYDSKAASREPVPRFAWNTITHTTHILHYNGYNEVSPSCTATALLQNCSARDTAPYNLMNSLGQGTVRRLMIQQTTSAQSRGRKNKEGKSACHPRLIFALPGLPHLECGLHRWHMND